MTFMDRLEIFILCAVLAPAALGALSLLFEALNRKDF